MSVLTQRIEKNKSFASADGKVLRDRSPGSESRYVEDHIDTCIEDIDNGRISKESVKKVRRIIEFFYEGKLKTTKWNKAHSRQSVLIQNINIVVQYQDQ